MISTHTAISLSPCHNLEIRKVTLANHGKEAKDFEITSYMEVVGDTHLAEISHPAFNKLFMESEFLEEQSIFLTKRRGKNSGESLYLMHMVKSGEKLSKQIEYENDRLRFIGRNNTPENPDAVVNSISLSNRSGFCNDPIMSLRVHITLAPGEAESVSFITGVCGGREEAVKISEELDIAYRIDDIFEKFRLQSEIELKYLEINKNQLNAFQDLISPIFYPSNYYRGPEQNIMRNNKNQSFLWRFGISGDNPIMLLMVKSIENAGIIKDVLKAYEYLRINRVLVDLAILIEAQHGYLQEVDDYINDMTSSLRIYDAGSEHPSFFILHSYEMIPAEIDLLYTVARVVFSDKTGIYFRNIKEDLDDLVEE
jgi:cellobiose phosphorylase